MPAWAEGQVTPRQESKALSMPPTKRILYYSHTRQVSGGERVLLTLLAVLDRTLYDPIAACPLTGPGNLETLLRQQHVDVVEAPVLQARFTSNPIKLLAYLASFFRAVLNFRATILKAEPDLLHANSVRAGIVATLATLRTRIPVLWHIHDDLPPHPISRLIRQLAFRSTRSRFVAVSHATARVFAGGLPFGPRMQVLHNAVDIARFPRKADPLDAEAQAFRNELGLTRDQPLVVAVGMINPRKCQLELIDAWSEMVESLEPQAANMRLAIVGAPIFNDDHLYEAKLKARIAELHLSRTITLTGPRGDVAAILRAANCSVLNASVEPFGLVLLESMSSGTPVLATAVGGIAEIVVPGESGWLIPPPLAPDHRRQLISALANVFSQPEVLTRWAENASAEVLPQFTIPVFATNLQALYASLTF